MFEPGSRYYPLETTSIEGPEGRILYKKRRFIPRDEERAVIGEVRIDQGDRLDLIAFQGFGDPTVFWQLCDHNRVVDPFAAQADLGRVLQITVRS